MTQEHQITDEWISELLVTALEGGCNRWIDGVRHMADPVRDRRESQEARFDPDGEFDDYFPYVVGYGGVIGLINKSGLHALTRSDVVRGVHAYIKRFDQCMHCLMEDHDAADADAIVQLGVLGGIVYD